MVQQLTQSPSRVSGTSRRDVIRVLICEDEALFRDLLQTSLSSFDQIDVVGAVDNGADAIRLATERKPDVVLMDIELGSEPNGIKAAHQIRSINSSIGIVILSMHMEKEYLANIPASRAAGWSYMRKQSVRDKASLVRVIEGASRGLVTMDPSIIEMLRPRRSSALERLNSQQLKLLEMLAGGYADHAIAKQLGTSVHGVAEHIEQIYETLKIDVDGPTDPRVEATLKYVRETSYGATAQA